MERKGNSVAVDMNMAILIVDDYKTMLKIIRNLLTQLGFGNVEEAVMEIARGRAFLKEYARLAAPREASHTPPNC